MKKLKYRQDKRKFVILTNGKKKNIKSLVVDDEFKDGCFIRKVIDKKCYDGININVEPTIILNNRNIDYRYLGGV